MEASGMAREGSWRGVEDLDTKSLIWDSTADHGLSSHAHNHSASGLSFPLAGSSSSHMSNHTVLPLADPRTELSVSTPVPQAAPSDKVGAGVGAVPPITAIWADMLDSTKGRDKVLKCVQYALKNYLYVLSLVAAVRPLSTWFRANQKRMKLAVSGLSLTRKCFLLLNPLHPLTHLLSPKPTSAPVLMGHLIDLGSALSDDVFCLSRLGLVSRRRGQKADLWANRFWLLTTVMGLWKLHLGTLPNLRANARAVASKSPSHGDLALREVKEQIEDAEWTNRKYLADLVFVSYDVFHLERFKEPVQAVTGLISALIRYVADEKRGLVLVLMVRVSTSKIYDKHWRTSLGKG